jgi:hypothetical protein
LLIGGGFESVDFELVGGDGVGAALREDTPTTGDGGLGRLDTLGFASGALAGGADLDLFKLAADVVRSEVLDTSLFTGSFLTETAEDLRIVVVGGINFTDLLELVVDL